MKTTALFVSLLVVITLHAAGFGQTSSWLDRPLQSWNKAGQAVPTAQITKGSSAITTRCRQSLRPASSAAESLLVAKGWSLFGPVQTYTGVSVVSAASDVDGMCRPLGYQYFVFIGGRFAGTVAPDPMNARTDGSASTVRLVNHSELWVEFDRYQQSDPLCCPSQKTTVRYRIERGSAGAVLVPQTVSNNKEMANSTPSAQSTVTGTVTYWQRMALPPNAEVIVKLVDVSRQDVPAITLGEQRIPANGKQVPFSFEIAYDATKINPASTYAVQARIVQGEQLLFISTTSHQVITQNRPSQIEIVVQPAPSPQTSAPGNHSLEQTAWELVKLNGKAVVATTNKQRKPYLRFDSSLKRAAFSAGCNTISGVYTLQGDSLSIKPGPSTRMFCQGIMEQEKALIDAMGSVTRWKIEGETLLLLANDTAVAEFRAQASKK
ncbi:MAG: YbaY family lipoprotein [Acidobacteria bacterium]|nr:YbaY family lipoprotein [Acidobacteriota bacterium]